MLTSACRVMRRQGPVVLDNFDYADAYEGHHDATEVMAYCHIPSLDPRSFNGLRVPYSLP